MEKGYFDFQQFRVWHDQCAMKVGTDGVLLAAWARLEEARHVLDVGCGSGVIALIAAQRSTARIVGIDVDPAAVRQAQFNVRQSPFAARVSILQADVRQPANTWPATPSPACPFDSILSNPPFFDETLLPPDKRKALARHTQDLSFAQLTAAAASLLTERGTFQVIVPYPAEQRLLAAGAEAGFWLTRRTRVVTRSGKPPKRSLLCLQRGPMPSSIADDELCLAEADGSRTAAYQALTAGLYLDRPSSSPLGR